MKRSNPTRSVPHAASGIGVGGDRSRTDFAGAADRRELRRSRPVLPPQPPPMFFLNEDIAEGLKPTPIYGQYPRGLIERVMPWLRCERREVLHVCSGALPKGEGIRVDVRIDARPDIIADGRHLPLADGSVVAVMIDPPYSRKYARSLYAIEYPLPSHLLREAARVVRPGGRIAFVHYITPRPVAGTRGVKTFGLSTGANMPMRALTIYERDQPELAL